MKLNTIVITGFLLIFSTSVKAAPIRDETQEVRLFGKGYGKETTKIEIAQDFRQQEDRLPDTIGTLINLKEIVISAPKLTGTLPDSVGNLVQLERLLIIHTDLTGVIPESLGRLKSLQSLILHNNQLTGQIPSSLGDLGQLTKLYLALNKLIGTIPESFTNLKSLKSLDLSSNQLTGTIPQEIGDLPHLEFVDLKENNLTGVYSNLLRKVERLNLTGNNLRVRDCLEGTLTEIQNYLAVIEVEGDRYRCDPGEFYLPSSKVLERRIKVQIVPIKF